ncbi:hypothetical protein evm_008929 [Chilo suppressalis]|nr:hypothetical protein evm_008929 [Chilo suppressalis]
MVKGRLNGLAMKSVHRAIINKNLNNFNDKVVESFAKNPRSNGGRVASSVLFNLSTDTTSHGVLQAQLRVLHLSLPINHSMRESLQQPTVGVFFPLLSKGRTRLHIISGCSRLANGEYLHRHNQVARIIHQQLALKYNLLASEVPYYRYAPEQVLENSHATLYWDRSIITDRTIVANKPDIVLIDRHERRAVVVDVAVPHDDNLVKAEKDKENKYLDLAREIVDMWDIDSAIVVPIIISAHGLIAKSLDKHLKRLALGGWVKSQMQKAVLLDTARIVRRFLSMDP